MRSHKVALFACLAAMFPGDVIHDVAPTSKPAPSGVKVAAMDAAKLARMRKLQRRAKQYRTSKGDDNAA
jgi:hypothetical protein